jgi:5'-phosphate synthase pdxT subunit
MKKKVGVLALQGCVEPHRKHIEALGCTFVPVRKAQDFAGLHALILPGGESSTMLKLLKLLDMEAALEKALREVPTWGICAGSILMAEKIRGLEQKSFGALPIIIRRNAYGRQSESFNTDVKGFEVAFIRAPIIEEITRPETTEVLLRVGEDPVWIHAGKHMATTFHPELNPLAPSPMHRYFIEDVLKY